MTIETGRTLRVASLSELPDNTPYAIVAAGVDVVLVRRGDDVSALYGRCAHRGALVSDGRVEGGLVVCGVHGWRYEIDSGVSPVNPAVALATFPAWVSDGSRATVDLMVVLARACGHQRLADFELDDLVTFDRDFAYLSGVPYAGAVPL